MNRHVRRFLVSIVLGYLTLQWIELAVPLVRFELDATERDRALVDEQRPPADVLDRAAIRDRAASAPHRHVGADPLRCELCLLSAEHAIHNVE